MPLPFLLIGAAALAGAAGVGTGVHGAVKMKEANDTMQSAKMCHEKNMQTLEKEQTSTNKSMDKLGKLELEILQSFSKFADVFEKIKNRPKFEKYTRNGVNLPKYDGEKLKEVSIGAGVLLGGLGGAGLGAAGGLAAAGATSAAVMALGTASTGTAIASLSGAAATNATLAALGGGAIGSSAAAGGIALGTTVLGATTLGIGLLVGGVIFNFTGGKLSDKADEAWSQMKKAEKQINKICDYLIELRQVADKYYKTLSSVNEIYTEHLTNLTKIIEILGHTNWNYFTTEEKQVTENSVLLVGLLYDMCKVELVLKSENENEINSINTNKINDSIINASAVLSAIQE